MHDQPAGNGTDPTLESTQGLTLVAVFENVVSANSCAADLKQRRPNLEVTLVNRRDDGPEQGMTPGPVITGPGYGLSAPNQSPPKDPGMGAGVSVGATIGATAGLLAATYIIPAFGVPLVTVGPLVSTLAGAGIGTFLGGLTQYASSEQQDGDDASQYAGQVRHGGVLLLVRTTAEEADEVRRQINLWNPLEIRVNEP